jgi:UDP-glucose 4-epimerase
MKRILITGASGFLGEKIFETLSSLGKYEIILGARNVSKLKAHEKFKSVETRKFDVSDSSTYVSAIAGINVIIHLAAMDYADCEKNPELARKVNVECLRDFTQSCSAADVEQFIYFSTFHVYGPEVSGLITEETPVNPVNTYSRTHYEAEQIVLAEKQFAGTVIRLSNAIGAPFYADSAAWKLVVNDLCRQAVVNKKMVLNSSGNQLRDFIPAGEIGNALEILIGKNETGIFNLGSGISQSILEMTEKIKKSCDALFGFCPDLKTATQSNEKHVVFQYSIKKIEKMGYKSGKTIEATLNEILQSI